MNLFSGLIKRKGIIFSALLLSLVGCGSNPAIESAQEFGLLAAQFEDNTNKLADDIYNSCIRRVRYMQVDTAVANQARNDALKQCEDFNKPAAMQARSANQVVTNYVIAIGRLASDDAVSFQDELNSIKDSLNNLSIPTATGTNISLPQGGVSTGISIANFIFNWAAKRFREGTLREAILCTDQSLQTYTDGLEFVFRDGYINGLLEQELLRVNSYYDYYAAILRNTNGTDKEFRELQLESFNAIDTVLQRRNASLSYVAIINKTANAHAALAKLFLGDENPPSKSSCAIYFNANQSDSTSINPENQQTFTLDFTVEELAKMKQIAINYQKEIEPLLIQMEEGLKE